VGAHGPFFLPTALFGFTHVVFEDDGTDGKTLSRQGLGDLVEVMSFGLQCGDLGNQKLDGFSLRQAVDGGFGEMVEGRLNGSDLVEEDLEAQGHADGPPGDLG
jgi:hypothetical protein